MCAASVIIATEFAKYPPVTSAPINIKATILTKTNFFMTAP